MNRTEESAFDDVYKGIMNYRRENRGSNPSKVTVNGDMLDRIKASPDVLCIMPFVGSHETFEDHFKTFLGIPFECVPHQQSDIIFHP